MVRNDMMPCTSTISPSNKKPANSRFRIPVVRIAIKLPHDHTEKNDMLLLVTAISGKKHCKLSVEQRCEFEKITQI
jgi:hypothetical protein